ncbi:MAG: choice-of-anchor D domain-containing protein [Verrucomicrobia bacterium]|nr:choice-of-anchor D domain-containing protein [Verrucomicrobiota bacterium]
MPTLRLLLSSLSLFVTAAFAAPPFAEFVDPNPNPGNNFGSSVVPLSTGNVVITSPNDDFGGTNAGAVYLFNGATGALISTLRGSNPNDNVGTVVTALSNGNYVVGSPQWDNGAAINAGAATWCNGTTGINGVVSSSNSLVGTTSSDSIGFKVVALSNGNYVVSSASWANGAATNAGAVTWGNGATGISGAVSSSNSLVGSNTGDNVGGNVPNGVIALSNGHYVVCSYNWKNGAFTAAGAVTWCNGTTGRTGAVSSSNSLVGGRNNDRVGSGRGTVFSSFNSPGVRTLSNGNYVVISPMWASGSVNAVGAVTWCDGSIGRTGLVTSSNSLVGTLEEDSVGSNDVVALSNGNYVVCSPTWDTTSMFNDLGAVTWADGTTGITGPVNASNSLIGSAATSQIGSGDGAGNGGGAIALTNGNYVVRSPNCTIGAVSGAGAVTWCNGSASTTGVPSSSNSLVGTSSSDIVGWNGVTALSNGNYVVCSKYWDNGAITDAGAVTWGNGTTGITGAVTSANSLVGSTVNDRVGTNAKALSNGNYVVTSIEWNNGAATFAGAVTWGSGITGITGTVSSTNSLVGNNASELLGVVTTLTNGHYVVSSGNWDNGAVTDVGAVAWCDGTAGRTGTLSSSNSLIGSTAGDNWGSVTALGNGNYVVTSASWDNGALVNAGAAAWGNGATGSTGTVSSSNSLVGLTSNSLLQTVVATDNVNLTYLVRFIADGGGKVRVGSQVDGLGAPSPEIAVEQPAATNLISGSASIPFGTRPAGNASAAKVFTIRNTGDAGLTLTAPAASGGNAGDFAVNNTGLLLTVPAAGQTTFSVIFTPGAGGARTTTLSIGNNDSNESPFNITLTGSGLVTTNDTDSDGLNDVAEFNFAALGFDWQTSQPALVTTLMNGASSANLYTTGQIQALNINTPLLTRNPTTGVFTLTIGIQKSTTLGSGSFVHFPFTPIETSINGAGKVEFQFTSPDNAAFFRLQAQ